MTRAAAVAGLVLSLLGCGREPPPQSPAKPSDPHLGTFEARREKSVERLILGAGGAATSEIDFKTADKDFQLAEGQMLRSSHEGTARWDGDLLMLTVPNVVDLQEAVFFLKDETLNQIDGARSEEFKRRADKHEAVGSYTKLTFFRIPPPLK